ncbi:MULTISPECIES: haloacid dehalogenase-like hydrolase [Microbacterium]|uniref:haloacid dehalogenase-like hydrolase n=1 Tax=Microbacterium TaxID=33882 RepID=UPI000D6541E4|nr:MULTISPECIES: haloacid dehalogenase-like hydrolase [Microbacterium]
MIARAGDQGVPGTQPEVALFDMDGVLTRHDSMAALIIRRLRAAPWRFAAAVPLVLTALAASPWGEVRPRVNRALVRLALRNVSPLQYVRLAGETAEALAADPDIGRHTIVAVLRQSHARTRAIVVTASEKTLARSYLDALGLNDVEVLASTLTVERRGLLMGSHNVGARKVQSLRAAGVALDQAVLYTDSASDLPLARAVRHTVLVNAGTRSTRAFRRAPEVSAESLRTR